MGGVARRRHIPYWMVKISSLPSESGDSTGSRATDWREEWWVRGAGRAPLRLLGSCAGSPRYPWRTFPIFSMWFRKRSRGRAPVDGRKRRRRASGGPTDVTVTRGFSGTPSAGILSAGHRLAGRKCPMDDHPGYIRGGSGSNAVRSRFFVSVKPLSAPPSPRLVARALHCAVPGPWRRRPPRSAAREEALGRDTFAGPEGAGGVL